MALQRLGTGELRGHDRHAEMPAAVFRSGVACMPMTVVDDLERDGMKCGLESSANARDALLVHGSYSAAPSPRPSDYRSSSLCDVDSLFAVFREIHTAWVTATRSSNPVMPNSLKSTHAFSEKL